MGAKIHLWIPDYASVTGGIQTFSRFILEGIRELHPDARIIVLSKNDGDALSKTTLAAADQVESFGRWSTRVRTPIFSAALFRRALIDRPDLIITTHVNFAPAAKWLQRGFGVPFVAIGHGVDVWYLKSEAVLRALRGADARVAVSEYTRRTMAEKAEVSAETISILPNTFSSERFAPGPKPDHLLQRYGLAPETPVLLTIARLASEDRYKGYDQLLRALPRIRASLPNVKYLLGGKGPDRARTEALIRELKLEDSVILPGFIPDAELPDHYNLCDVFAMPSKGEGFGIVFLEALACGKPVMAGNKDGSVDPLLNGKLGALVDPDDVKQIADTLIQILSGTYPNTLMYDPEGLRREVIDAYGYERFKERLREILEPILDRRSHHVG